MKTEKMNGNTVENVDCMLLGYQERNTSKGNVYIRFETDEGFYNCFDLTLGEKLKELSGDGDVTLIIETSKGGFKNIVDFKESKEEQTQLKPLNISNSNNSNASFYTSYAKDIFCVLLDSDKMVNTTGNVSISLNEIMKFAIDLVKQAKSSFEND